MDFLGPKLTVADQNESARLLGGTQTLPFWRRVFCCCRNRSVGGHIPLPPQKQLTNGRRRTWSKDGERMSDSEYHDAYSEDDGSKTDLARPHMPMLGAPPQLPKAPMRGISAGTPHLADQLLATLQWVEKRCLRQAAAQAKGMEMEDDEFIKVESLNNEGGVQVWRCEVIGCSAITGCFRSQLPNVTMDEAISAMTDPQQRLVWDTCFSVLDVLRSPEAEELGGPDVVRVVFKSPRPLKDRDMLQFRWFRTFSGGKALVFISVEDDEIAAPQPEYVRAYSHCSGHIFRPVNGGQGVEIVGVSQIDVGGNIPQWTQNMVQRWTSGQPGDFFKRLGEHVAKQRKEQGLLVRQAPMVAAAETSGTAVSGNPEFRH